MVTHILGVAPVGASSQSPSSSHSSLAASFWAIPASCVGWAGCLALRLATAGYDGRAAGMHTPGLSGIRLSESVCLVPLAPPEG
jgi:hypothetical protein